MTSAFDVSAPTFERHRAFPPEAPQAIRAAIWSAAGFSRPNRVLDIGAGTGRIGRAFLQAGDDYTGVDASAGMLAEFPPPSGNGRLIQADAAHLPFPEGAFDVVLLMQVLSTVDDWRPIVAEASRVVRSGGCVVVGHPVNPESGVEAKLKRQLKHILEDLGVAPFPTEQARRQALAWFESAAARHVHLVASSWRVSTTPRSFLLRHRTGARFASLPAHIQKQALDKLETWADTAFGSLDTECAETRSFELDIYQF